MSFEILKTSNEKLISLGVEHDHFDSLLAAATTYGNQLSNIFSLFITVVFGSIAFSAAISLRDIGGKVFNTNISKASGFFGIVLLSFYLISLWAFIKTEYRLRGLLGELYSQVKTWSIQKEAIEAFAADPLVIWCFSWASLGYVIGSIGGLVMFMWVANIERNA